MTTQGKSETNNDFSDNEDEFNQKLTFQDNKNISPGMFRCSKCLRITLNYVELNSSEFKIYSLCQQCKEKRTHNEERFISTYNSFDSINCSTCKKEKKRKKEIYNYCVECKKIFCNFCKRQHKEHEDLINLNIFDSTCEKHCFSYTHYCEKCNISLCPLCLNIHQKEHKCEPLFNLYMNKELSDKYQTKINELNAFIKDLKTLTKDIIDMLNKLIKFLMTNVEKYIKKSESLYHMSKIILNFSNFASENQDMCYEQLKTLKNFFNFSDHEKSKTNFNKIKNEKNGFKKILDLINFLNNKENFWIKTSDNIEEIKNEFETNKGEFLTEFINQKEKEVMDYFYFPNSQDTFTGNNTPTPNENNNINNDKRNIDFITNTPFEDNNINNDKRNIDFITNTPFEDNNIKIDKRNIGLIINTPFEDENQNNDNINKSNIVKKFLSIFTG